ncbi:HAD-IIB family hydrolase [Marinicrinis lubricantis]|uniref:HAD-IIB family hydrolase n=1 Tax=Marinicrinis lubricantis TaxID=2086470 RepID=A0ABW1IKI2_9BACL
MYFIFDLDGTICFGGKPVSEKILRALDHLKREGHEAIFASARPIRDMLPVIHERFHLHRMIGGNGSLMSENGKVVDAQSFSENERHALLDLIHKYHATYLIDGDWDYAYTGSSNHPILRNVDPAGRARSVSLDRLDAMVKALILTSDDQEKLAKEIAVLGVTIHEHRNEGVLDVSPAGIHKWSAIKQLGVEQGSFIAFGNDANDVTMFEHAGYRVRIGDHPLLSQAADESISLEGDFEQSIAERIMELSRTFRE